MLPAFICAVTVLMLIPGPNVALITANSVAHGVRFGLLTVAATTAAMAVQLGLTALGLTAFLGAAGTVFFWLRWLGTGDELRKQRRIDDSLWAILAHEARRLLTRYGKIHNRLTGGLLIGAGLGLAARSR